MLRLSNMMTKSSISTRRMIQPSIRQLHIRRLVQIPQIRSVAKRFTSSNTAQSIENQFAGCHKSVAYWLLGMSGLVAGMVTIGGITRLTRSGLSMTDWKLQGSLPPTNLQEWEIEFERYKQYPEWQQRQSMTLDEFKFIFFWEYGHRMMGRFIGIAFVVPCSYFLARGMIPKSMYPRMGLLLGLGGGQGLVGWWMVRSGLQGGDVDELKRLQREIRVSPYRLATHLSVAFVTYTTLIWTALSILNPAQTAKSVANTLSSDALQYARRLRGMTGVTGALVATTVLSGAFVAGNDAGNAYNTFPLMDDKWVPPSEFLWELSPTWRNFFESTALVQFDHRVLAMSTLAAIASTLGFARFGSAGRQHWKQLPGYCRAAAYMVGAMGLGQVALGISTLLMYVPVPLAAAHQAGSLVLLTLVTGFAHSLSFSKYAPPAAVKTASSLASPSGGAMTGRYTGGGFGGIVTGPAVGSMAGTAVQQKAFHTMSKSHTSGAFHRLKNHHKEFADRAISKTIASLK